MYLIISIYTSCPAQNHSPKTNITGRVRWDRWRLKGILVQLCWRWWALGRHALQQENVFKTGGNKQISE